MLFRSLPHVAIAERNFPQFLLSILFQPKQETRRHLIENIVGVLVDWFWTQYVPYRDRKPSHPKTSFCILRYRKMNKALTLYIITYLDRLAASQTTCHPPDTPWSDHQQVCSPDHTPERLYFGK